MIKADRHLKETIYEILEEGQWDKKPRTKWADGTPAHSKFVTQKVFQYDISKGEYPINTLRTTALKGALGEILTIYRDQSNKQEDFIRNGVNWWGDWMNEEGNLGTAYAWNLEPYCESSRKYFIKVPKKEPLSENCEYLPKFEELYTSEKYAQSNRVIKGKFCDYRVLDRISYFKYKIQLLDCGIVIESGLRKDVMSPFYKSIGDIFYYGDYSKSKLDEITIKLLMKVWRNMTDRIVGKGKNNKKYSISNVTDRWHSFSNFLEDIVYVPHYFSAKRDEFKDWVLDRDYYGANFYSKNTCAFIKNKENLLYRSSQKIYKVDNNFFGSTREVGEYLGITGKRVLNILNTSPKNITEKNKNILDKIEIVNDLDNVYRLPIVKNQLNELLFNIENNPFGRRHLLSFFNFENQNKKQLMECAFETMWSVRDDENGDEMQGKWYKTRYIDLTLIQRSQDFAVTSSINPAQYVMFAMMVCNHLTFKTGIKHEVGKLLHIVQNCHIYDRHLDAAKEILKRESTKLQPKIELICEPKDFYLHTVDDFKFSNLEGIKPLTEKLEIAI